MILLTEEQIDAIAKAQTEVTCGGNGPFLVKDQMKHAIKQALKLSAGEEIILPNGKKMQ